MLGAGARLAKGIASLPKAMDVLKTRFVGAKNLDKLKLTDDPQVFDLNLEYSVPLGNEHIRYAPSVIEAKRKAFIPKKTFPKIFEKAVTGEISKLDAAKELGPLFYKTRTEKGRTGEVINSQFKNLFNSYVKLRPDDLFTEGGKPREFIAGFNQRPMPPIAIKQINDILEIADKGSKKIPFNKRFYEAFMKLTGGSSQTLPEKWSQAKDLGAQLKVLKGQPPENFTIPKTFRFDKKGNIVDIANPKAGKTPKDMFDEAPVGEILKSSARNWAFRVHIDTGGKWGTVEKQIKTLPGVNRYLEPIKNAAPKDSLGYPITSNLYQVDHKVPHRFGGTNDKSNLRLIVQGQHSGPLLEKGMTSVDNVVKA